MKKFNIKQIKTLFTLCVFRGFSFNEAIAMTKKFNLKRSMNKDIIYGALLELSRNKQVWYESSISPEYSHLTVDGREAIVHVVEVMFRSLQDIHQEEIKEEAHKQTINALKS